MTKTRALDRILLWNHFVIPNWHYNKFRLAYWSKLKRPQNLSGISPLVVQSWWIDPASQTAPASKNKGNPMPVPRLVIAIPARYGSSRFPGKPLAEIAGRSMLSRVVDLARRAVVLSGAADVAVFVATEDKRIAAHAEEIGVPCIMTPDTCATGSDRVLAALRQLDHWPDFIINLQGMCPSRHPPCCGRCSKPFFPNPNTR